MYDILEASSVKKETVRLMLDVDGESVQRDVRVLDLFSKNKIEFMKAVDVHTKKEMLLPLDSIQSILPSKTIQA